MQWGFELISTDFIFCPKDQDSAAPAQVVDSESVVVQPLKSEPVLVQPVESEPVVVQPVESEPVVVQPIENQPTVVQLVLVQVEPAAEDADAQPISTSETVATVYSNVRSLEDAEEETLTDLRQSTAPWPALLGTSMTQSTMIRIEVGPSFFPFYCFF